MDAVIETSAADAKYLLLMLLALSSTLSYSDITISHTEAAAALAV